MRFGFALPNVGPIGTPDNVRNVAQRAEELGYSSLWTIERLLYPVRPQTPYPASSDGSLPEPYKLVLDPLDALTYAAAYTRKINLGTSVLDIPYYNPVLLARRLNTIDVLSSGRLLVGLGLGWSKDEMDATGARMSERGARADEFLQVLKAIWTQDPVEHTGKYYQIPKSFIGPKPVRKPHPPIYMAAFAPAALNRIARLADGWNPVAIPVDGMEQMFGSIRKMASEAGRDPESLQMIVRANVHITPDSLPEGRFIFSGSFEQIVHDIEACKRIRAHEIVFDPTFAPGGQELATWNALMERFSALPH